MNTKIFNNSTANVNTTPHSRYGMSTVVSKLRTRDITMPFIRSTKPFSSGLYALLVHKIHSFSAKERLELSAIKLPSLVRGKHLDVMDLSDKHVT